MNDKLVKLTRILFGIIAILTILLILVFIFDSKINKEITQKFLSIYGVSFLLFLFYIPICTFVQLKYLNRRDSKDRIIKFTKGFIGYFLILGLLSIILKSNHFDLFYIIAISFGTSFGFNFLDLLFFRKTSESNWS